MLSLNTAILNIQVIFVLAIQNCGMGIWRGEAIRTLEVGYRVTEA